MSAHLTTEELTDSLLGVSSLTVNAHLLNCPACASELDRLKNSIAEFRGAAHAWSENSTAGERTVSIAGALPRRSWAANWVLAAAAVIVFAAGLISYRRDHRLGSRDQSAQVAAPAIIVEGSAAQIEKDNELMSQVNSEIAEAVPAPMQPLQLSQSAASNDSSAK
jgi:anti-sigma factor RsiW